MAVLSAGGWAAPDAAGTPKADQSLAAATKEKPFENSLGMKFVPVPITGGPTDGKRVLFSVWKTRVCDYDAFAREAVRLMPKVESEQGPTHPVVNVSWEDARAFCAWLTERERKAGKLGANERYRLPTDHEWSCAVGIGDREDAEKSPAEKDGKLADVFPWGATWPPPKDAGNYDSTLKVDSHHYSSPVGSFPANRHGLYDMGGNVWEWCEDEYRTGSQTRVLRGASWYDAARDDLLSSSRYCLRPLSRVSTYGFRCVVGASSPER